MQQVQATGGAFAAVLTDGTVVTWGPAAYGGDSRAVQDQLKNVEQIQASCRAGSAEKCTADPILPGVLLLDVLLQPFLATDPS